MCRKKSASLHFLSAALKAAQKRRQSQPDKAVCERRLHSLHNACVHATHDSVFVRWELPLHHSVQNCRCSRAFATSATRADAGNGDQAAFADSALRADVINGNQMTNEVSTQADVDNGNLLPVGRPYAYSLPIMPRGTPLSHNGDVFFETEDSDNEDSLEVEKEDSAGMDITLFGQAGRSETAMLMYQILNTERWCSPDTEAKLSSAARRLSPDLVIEVVKLLKNGNMALSFLNWAKDQQGYQPRAEAFTHVIARFGRERDFNSAWRLLVEMKVLKLPMDFTFSIFLHRLKRAKRAQGLVKAMCGMKFLGVMPTVALYTSALEFLLKVGAQDDVAHLHKQMLEDGLVPDKKLYEVLVVGFIKLGRLDDALLLFNDMKDRGYVPHVSVYSALIGSLSVARRLDRGHELYLEMIATGCAPPKVFGIDEIVCALHGNNIIELVEKFLKLVERVPYKWKVQSHNNLLQCLLDSGRTNETKTIFQRIAREEGARAKNARNRVKNAAQKDFIMCHWNLNSYHIYIIGMCKLGQLDHAMDTFKELLDRHLKPTDEISSFLLLSLSKAKRIDEALAFCKHILEAREAIGVDAQHSFFSALQTSGNLSAALKIFKLMKRKKCIDQDADFVTLIGLENKEDMSLVAA